MALFGPPSFLRFWVGRFLAFVAFGLIGPFGCAVPARVRVSVCVFPWFVFCVLGFVCWCTTCPLWSAVPVFRFFPCLGGCWARSGSSRFGLRLRLHALPLAVGVHAPVVLRQMSGVPLCPSSLLFCVVFLPPPAACSHIMSPGPSSLVRRSD